MQILTLVGGKFDGEAHRSTNPDIKGLVKDSINPRMRSVYIRRGDKLYLAAAGHPDSLPVSAVRELHRTFEVLE